MAKPTPSVDQFVAALTHPAKPSALLLREAILAGHPGLTERVKWNAPSFCDADDDRVTFRFMPKGSGLQIIFHRGVAPKPTASFRFDDPSGLIAWAAPDRGVITLAGELEARQHVHAVVALVGAWVQATREC